MMLKKCNRNMLQIFVTSIIDINNYKLYKFIYVDSYIYESI